MNVSNTLYEKMTKKKAFSWTMIFVAAILYTFGVQAFLQSAKTFSAGLGAFAQLVTFIDVKLSNYFSIIYLALNIPIILIFWRKIKRKFVYRTFFFLLTQAALGTIFFIPEVRTAFSRILYIENVSNAPDPDLALRQLSWPILVLALIGSGFVGMAVAISWKFGGSTGGTDVIVYYFSSKQKKSVGGIMFAISTLMILISFAISVPLNSEMKEHWLITLVSTFAYMGITTVIVNRVYPKYSKVRVQIHSSKHKELLKMLKDSNYPHAYLIKSYISGYDGEKKIHIETAILLLEVKQLLKNVYAVDPHAWVSESKIRRVWGNFDTTEVE